MRKGQMEAIVILGIFFVIVIVALYAVQQGTIFPSPVPKGVYDEQREVANSVKNVIRDAASKTLRTMMAHGGYLEDKSIAGMSYEDVSHTDFLLKGVPFWQQCDNVMYPDIEDVRKWMEASIKKTVREGMDDVESLYGNKSSVQVSLSCFFLGNLAMHENLFLPLIREELFPSLIGFCLFENSFHRDFCLAGPYHVL